MSTKQHEETIGRISASWPIAIDVFAEWIGEMQAKGATDVRFWVNGDKREGEYYFVDAFRTFTEEELRQKEIVALEQKLAELKSQQPHTCS